MSIFHRHKPLYNRHRPVVELMSRVVDLSTELSMEAGVLHEVGTHDGPLADWQDVKFNSVNQLQSELDAFLDETQERLLEFLNRGNRVLPFNGL